MNEKRNLILSILLYISPIILFWLLAFVSLLTNVVRSTEGFSFANDLFVGFIGSLAFLPIFIAAIFYCISVVAKKAKIAIACLAILCFHLISTVCIFLIPSIMYLFATSFLGVIIGLDNTGVAYLTALIVFWLYTTAIVVLFSKNIIKKIKEEKNHEKK